MDHRVFWEQVYADFDPEEPARDSQTRAPRPYSPAAAIVAGVRRPFGERRFLFLGTVGTGKSTELHRIGQECAEDGLVVLVDLVRHFSDRLGDAHAIQHVQPWEVLLVLGAAVYAAGDQRFGHRWKRAEVVQYEEAASQLVAGEESSERPAVDIGRLAAATLVLAGGAAGGPAGAVVGAALTTIGGVASDSVSWEVPIGLPSRKRLVDQDARVQKLLHSVNGLLGSMQARTGRLLLLVDGLDRITNQDTTRRLFVDSTLLGSLECATVLTAPLVLRRDGLASLVRRFDPKVLASAPVRDRHAPSQHGPGVDFCVDVFLHRVAEDRAEAIPEALLRRLAFASGGRLREFVRMVRMAAEHCWDRSLAQADEAVVASVIDERRRIMELGIRTGHIELLERVARDRDHRLPDDDAVDLLLERFYLLPYPNEQEWYYPHPLLTERAVRP